MKRSAALVLALLSLACSRSGLRPVVVYSPHGKEMLSAFAGAYESLHPDQQVQWLDMGSQDVYDRIRTERENPQADLWWGAPMTAFSRAEREGLLQQYTPSWDSALPRSCKSAGGFWSGTFLTPEVIMYNSARVDSAAAPRDWDDLLSPAWHGKIVIRSPLASGTMRIIFGSMIMRELQRGGSVSSAMHWLRKLDANTRAYAADPTQLYLMIAREEGLVTLWDLPDVMIQVQTNSYPFAFVMPASGTPLITDAIAIVRGAQHPEEARQLYEFLTSRESMVRQAREFFRIPTRTDIPRSDLPAWMSTLELKALPVDFDSIAAHEKEWMSIWDQTVRGRGASEGN